MDSHTRSNSITPSEPLAKDSDIKIQENESSTTPPNLSNISKWKTSQNSEFIKLRNPPKQSSKPSDASTMKRDTLDLDQTASPEKSPIPENIKKQKTSGPKPVTGWEQAGAVQSGQVQKQLDSINKILDMIDRTGMWRNCAGFFCLMYFTYVLTALGFGFFGFLLSAAFGVQWYNNSIRRFRNAARDDITRSLERDKLIINGESAGWMNEFLSRFWIIYEPVLSATVVDIGNSIMDQQTPSFLDSIKLTTFTLGTKAPRIESINTHVSEVDLDLIAMDWDVSFTPNDIIDIPRALLADRVNPKVVLSVRVGKGIVGAALPIMVEDMVFKGKMQIRLRLSKNFPFAKTAEVCFIEQPTIDFVLKPVGGNTFGFDIAHIPGLRDFIMSMVHSNMAPMLYAPNFFTLDLESIINGTVASIEGASGVVIVNVRCARNLKKADTFGKSDPYIKIFSANKPLESSRTTHKNETLNPTWNEVLILLLYNTKDLINFEVYDWNQVGKDEKIGLATVDPQILLESNEQAEMTLPVSIQGSRAGDLDVSIGYYPVAEKKKPAPKVPQSTTEKESAVDSQPVIECPEFKKSDSPTWELGKEIFIPDQTATDITILLKNNGNRLGLVKFNLMEMILKRLESVELGQEQGTDWINIPGLPKGQLRVEVKWRPIIMDSEVASTLELSKKIVYPPIGLVKFNIREASFQKGSQVLQSNNPDPYIRIQVQNNVLGRTSWVLDTTKPVWNETIFVPIASLKHTIILECMNHNNNGKDKTIGDVLIPARNLLGDEIQDSGNPSYQRIQLRDISGDIRQRNGKLAGKLLYSATFIPLINFDDDLTSGAITSINTNMGDSKSADAQSTDIRDASINQAPGVEGARSIVENRELQKFPLLPAIDYNQFNSGILTITVVAVKNLQKPVSGVSVRVTMNRDVDLPIGITTVSRRSGQSHEWDNETFQSALTEADLSKLMFEVRTMIPGRSEPLEIGKINYSVKEYIEKGFINKSGYQSIPLQNNSGELVVNIRLDPTEEPSILPEESLANNGVLSLNLVSGHNLPGADSSGTSDPYVVISVNGTKVFKSETKKKTINPIWNEKVSFNIRNRKWMTLTADIFDWNQIQSDERIGTFSVPLSELETNKLSEKDCYLTGFSPDPKSPYVKLQFMFSPCHVTQSSTGGLALLSAAQAVAGAPITIIKGGTRIAGNIVGGGAKAVGSGATFVAEGGVKLVGGGAKMLGGGAKSVGMGAISVGSSAFSAVEPQSIPQQGSKDKYGLLPSFGSNEPSENVPNADTNPTASSSNRTLPSTGVSKPTSFPHAGKLNISVVDAVLLDNKDRSLYTRVNMNMKQLHKTKVEKKTHTAVWNETFSVPILAGSKPILEVMVKEFARFGENKTIASQSIDPFEELKDQFAEPESISTVPKTIHVTNDEVKLTLKLGYEQSSHGNASAGSPYESGSHTNHDESWEHDDKSSKRSSRRKSNHSFVASLKNFRL
ncbi:hypothetical protein BB558_000658 [Smittium angustum]|uniref:C2 domain-containing protein n=1 Tax=Smittium angustum TaxID=133377 RepID=A0A2U1JDT2_SMIAN|nr:hypothetical protein BB558_000658 [Smittium angustum]